MAIAKPENGFPAHFNFEKRTALKINECGHTYSHGVQRFGIFCPIGRGRWTRDGGFHIRPVCC